MGTALVGNIHHPDAFRDADGNPHPCSGKREGESGEPEGYRTERLYHRTVLTIPSSQENGGTNPISSRIFAELTRNEEVTFRKSSEIVLAARPSADGNGRKRGTFPSSRQIEE
jgi:hypothetical protein